MMQALTPNRRTSLASLAAALVVPLLWSAAKPVTTAVVVTGAGVSACAAGGALTVIGIFTAQPEVIGIGLFLGAITCGGS